MGKGADTWVREEIRALKAYSVVPAEGMVKLDAMENPYRLPPELAAELGQRLAAVPINRYPDPRADALKSVLRRVMDIGADLPLTLGNGSDELLQVIALALARPGAMMLSLEPSFVMYRMSATIAGMGYVGVPLRPDFSIDLDATLHAIATHRPALVWVAYPNNPTGNLYSREAIEAILAAAPGLVVVDEAYYPFAGGASFLPDCVRRENLVVVRTVSKLGLAGLRLGLATGPADWIAAFDKVRLPYNVNALTMVAAQFVLEHDGVLEEQSRRIVAERARLEAGLDAIAGLVRFPSAANFVLARLPDAARAFEGLRARKILVRNLHGHHPLLDHCLRFTVGTADENAALLEALGEVTG